MSRAITDDFANVSASNRDKAIFVRTYSHLTVSDLAGVVFERPNGEEWSLTTLEAQEIVDKIAACMADVSVFTLTQWEQTTLVSLGINAFVPIIPSFDPAMRAGVSSVSPRGKGLGRGNPISGSAAVKHIQPKSNNAAAAAQASSMGSPQGVIIKWTGANQMSVQGYAYYTGTMGADVVAMMKDVLPSLDLKDFEDWTQKAQYVGFSRMIATDAALTKFGIKSCIKISILVAMRGTNPANVGQFKITDVHGLEHTIDEWIGMDMLVQSTRRAPAPVLSLARIAACFPEAAAWVLMKMRTHENQFPQVKIPPWLSFPAASGIRISALFTDRIVEWNGVFSKQIPGSKPQPNLTRKAQATAPDLAGLGWYDDLVVQSEAWMANN